MSGKVTFNYSAAKSFIADTEIEMIAKAVEGAKETLLNKTGAGNDFLGWIDLPVNYDKEEFARINEAAKKIQSDSEVLLVIGIGGSYLGARAAIEFLRHSFYNSVSKEIRKTPEIYYVGNNISSTYISNLIEVIGNRNFSINIISKSGTTTEPAIAFRVFKKLLIEKYGKAEAAKRIYATTDKARGALKNLATEEGYESFVVPDDIGGRFSVLTAVGLLPIAASGADIAKLMEGAAAMRERCLNQPFASNDAMLYAAIRNILLRKGKSVEILANYEPFLHYVSEWWKQLFGESEGKDQKGIFPAAVDLTTDLHSMGQFIQDGQRTMFETIINLEKPSHEIFLEEEEVDLDGLNYLAGKSVDFINKSAMKGTLLAHTDGNVPNLIVNLPEQSEESLGELFYFFEFACGISGYLLGVNPFDQPGVESYKKNMFALLGKPGFEKQREELLKRL
ncbi:glucose-6-phosphate isomerase [Anaerocolumna xylanovorans]|uniref:Glucose-6-phosphate isomerase n=1 Tax=Anaerocolumna xylanovorans DSM 12503 TaxID=1121345 RepID=A0A1M7YMN5_9FIRM|nr:glucose-6-phosphate isomerase [Anaerocolumna xylanovorans]SHO53842.1 glucose-6-phosphate isomerase [Anaerocolumna xylanovorans DSM 12503]